MPAFSMVSTTGLSTVTGLVGFLVVRLCPGTASSTAPASSQRTHRQRGDNRRPVGKSRKTTA